MDETDRRILREMQHNGRLSNAELAERVNLSPSPCLRRLRNLEKTGVIKGYSAIADPKACGLPITVFVQIRLSPHSKQTAQTFESRIMRLDAVMECHLMTGDTDYLLRVVVASLEAYEDFIRDCIHPIPAVASINTSFAYGVVKQSRCLPS